MSYRFIHTGEQIDAAVLSIAEVPGDYFLVPSYYISRTSGNPGASGAYKATNFLPFDRTNLVVSGYDSNGTNASCLLAFYDSDRVFIESYTTGSAGQKSNITVPVEDIPETAVYIRLSALAAQDARLDSLLDMATVSNDVANKTIEITASVPVLLEPLKAGLDGGLYDLADPTTLLYNGGVNRYIGDRLMGFTIPVGQVGTDSLMQGWIDFDADEQAALIGKGMRITLGGNTSALLPVTSALSYKDAEGVTQTLTYTTAITQTESRAVATYDFIFPSDAVTFRPVVRYTGTSAAESEQYFELTDAKIEVTSTTSDVNTVAEENLEIRVDRQSTRIAEASTLGLVGQIVTDTVSPVTTVVVKPDGTGDYTTVALALASITDSSATNRYEVLIYPGVYTDVDMVPPDYVDLRGTDTATCILRGYLPPETAPATITGTSTIWMNYNNKFSNLTITAQNMRYPIHADSQGLNVDGINRLEDCHIEHFGNDEARDWQTANGGDPADIWSSEHPFGCGGASGLRIIAKRTTFESFYDGFYFHTAADFDDPMIVTLEQCRLLAKKAGGHAVSVQPLGSRQNDVIELIGCELLGDITYVPSPWLQQTLDYQPSDLSEILVIGSGNTPVPHFPNDYTARALRIESASTAEDSSVVVSGDAVPIIFGDPITESGGGGLQGAVYGSINILDNGNIGNPRVNITMLGKRLGDCTVVNKTLTVLFNGVTSVDVVFDQDYTEEDYLTTIATIDTALGANGTASAMNVTNRYRPTFTDQEKLVKNVDTVSIKRYSGAAYQTDDMSVRVMTSSDAAGLFAGLAMEDIRPGEWGKIKTNGVVYTEYDVLRSDAAAYVLGNTLGIGATDGQFEVGASVPLLTAVSATAVKFDAR